MVTKRTKYLDTAMTPGTYNAQEGVFFRVGDRWYFADRWTDHEPIHAIRWDHKRGEYVTDRKRDFGGCGKDAIKLEVGVPFLGWLAETDIAGVSCDFCDSPKVVQLEPLDGLVPVCRECSAGKLN